MFELNPTLRMDMAKLYFMPVVVCEARLKRVCYIRSMENTLASMIDAAKTLACIVETRPKVTSILKVRQGLL